MERAVDPYFAVAVRVSLLFGICPTAQQRDAAMCEAARAQSLIEALYRRAADTTVVKDISSHVPIP